MRCGQGNAEAQQALGLMYYACNNVPKNSAAAAHLYRLAADHARADAHQKPMRNKSVVVQACRKTMWPHVCDQTQPARWGSGLATTFVRGVQP
jgi:hypothetical protein